MNTLKRKLTAILLTFAMLFSLMPALPQAAEAANGFAENDSFSIQYNLPGVPAYDTGDVTVTLQDVAGENIGEPLKISEYPKLIVTGNTFSLSDDLSQKYVIKGIRVSGDYIETESTNLTSFTSSGSSATFNFHLPGNSATITIILGEISDEPKINNPLPESTSRLYRIYDDQILKMLYSQGIQVTKDTEINSVSPEWFSVFFTNGLNFTSVDGITDFRRLEVSDDPGEAYNVNPGNLKGLEITYNNGEGNQTITIPYSDLCFVGDQDGAITFYRIESANDSIHVVYFLDAYGAIGATGPSNYDRLYDLRFVKNGDPIGSLPEEPEYGSSGYEFINWEIGSYDGSGQPLLPTTIINRDMIVYSHKLLAAEDAGTAFHVMNDSYDVNGNLYEDQLLNRIEELSGQKINWTEDDKDSIKITVHGGGKATNPEYLNVNSWKDDYTYYEVLNYNAETGELTPVDQNTHVRFDQVEYITVDYSIDDVAQSPVQINVGDQVGELSPMLQGGDVGAEQHVLILRLNLPGEVIDDGAEPDPGSIDWDKLTIKKEVNPKTAKPGDTVTYKITVTNSTGIDLTNVKVSDELDEDLTFVSAEPVNSYVEVEGAWTIGELTNGNSATLTITAKVNDDVAAGTTIKNAATITDAKAGDDTLPDEDKPSAKVDVTVEPKDPTPPSEEDITKLINEAEVTVNCTNDQAGHESLTVTFGEVKDAKFETTQSGDTITVTVDDGAFIANYVANRNNIPHSYVADGSDLTLTLKYVENVWKLDSSDNKVTINTICKLPQEPTKDELIELLNQATADVECITMGSNHKKESFNFGNVKNYKFTTEKSDPYTITVEVDPAAFIEKYDEVYKLEVHTFVQSEDVKQDVQLVVKFVDGAWILAENTINIKVSCGSDTPGGDTPGGNDPWYPPYNPGDDDKPSGLNTEDHFSYVVGYEDGMVKPQRSITRAEVATIFYRLLEDDVREDYDTTRNNFSDVTSDSWYNQTVSTLASMGILKGYEDGTFRPNASITRAEFAAIATRFFDETGATYEPGTFTDVTGDEWFAGAIMDAVNLGLIGGYEDGTVRPNNNITRAEACAIVNRTLGRVPDADHLLPADEMTTWPDNPSSAWFYADMQEATNGHEYEWITEDGNKIEEWTYILDKDWNDR